MKLLVLASRFPYPLEKGDKLRLYHQLREWSRTCEITLFALTDAPVSPADLAEIALYCHRIEVFQLRKMAQAWGIMSAFWQNKPLQTGYFFDQKARQRLELLANEVAPDHLFCQLVRTAAYAEKIAIPATIDYMDTFSLGMERRKKRSPWWLKPILSREAHTLARWEARVFRWFRGHSIISQQDRDALAFPDAQNIAVVPNGVDTAYFSFQENPDPAYEIAFVGNLGYFPNRQATQTLIKEIMPKVWAARPETRVLLAGARPTAEMKSWEADPRIKVTGWLDDIRDAYRQAGLLVAPLFTGSGQQNKILEAMSMGVPCITTAIVNQALGADTDREIAVANDPEAFTAAILDLLANREKAENQRRQARTWVEATYSWAASAEKMKALFEKTQD